MVAMWGAITAPYSNATEEAPSGIHSPPPHLKVGEHWYLSLGCAGR